MRKNSWVWDFNRLSADDGIRFTNHMTGLSSIRYGYSPTDAQTLCDYLNSRG